MPIIHDANDRDDTIVHQQVFTDINAAKFEHDYKLIKYLTEAHDQENNSIYIDEESNPVNGNGQKESLLYLASMRYHGFSHFLLNQPFTLARFAHNIKQQKYIALLSAGGYGGVHDSEPVFHIARAYLGITKNQFSYPPYTTPAKSVGDVQSEFSEALLGRLLPGELFYRFKWHELVNGLPADADVQEGMIHVVKDTVANELQFKVKIDSNEIKKGIITATEFVQMCDVNSQKSLTRNKDPLFAILKKRKHGKQLEKKTFNAAYWNADGTLNKGSPEVQDLFEQKKRTAYRQAEYEHKSAIYQKAKAKYDKNFNISDDTQQKVKNAIADFKKQRNKSEAEYTLDDKNAVLAFQYKQMVMATGKVERLKYDDELEGVFSVKKGKLLTRNADIAHKIITTGYIETDEQAVFFNEICPGIDLKFFPHKLSEVEKNAFTNHFITHQIHTENEVSETLVLIGNEEQVDDESFKNKVCYPHIKTPEEPNYILTYLIEAENEKGHTSRLTVTIDLEVFYQQYLKNNGDLAFGEHDGGTKFFAHLRGLMSQNIKVESNAENGITLVYDGPIAESELTTPLSHLLLRDDDNKYLKFHRGAGAKAILADTFVSSSYKKEMEKTLKNECNKLKEFEKQAEKNQQQIKETKKKIGVMEKRLNDKQTENKWRTKNPPTHLEAGYRLLLPDEMHEDDKTTVLQSLKECELALRHLTKMKGDYYQYAGYDELVGTYSELMLALSTEEVGQLLNRMTIFCSNCAAMESTIRQQIDHRKSRFPAENGALKDAIEATEIAVQAMKEALTVGQTIYTYNEADELSRLFDILKNDARLRLSYFLPNVNTDIAMFMSTNDLMASLEKVRLKAEFLSAENNLNSIPFLIGTLNKSIKSNKSNFSVEENIDEEVAQQNRETIFNNNIASLDACCYQNDSDDDDLDVQNKLRLAYLIIEKAYAQYKTEYNNARNSLKEIPLFLRNAPRNQELKNLLKKEGLDLLTQYNTKMFDLEPNLKTWVAFGKDVLKKTEVLAWQNRNHQVWAHIGKKSEDNIELKPEDHFIFPTLTKLKSHEKFFDLTLDDKGEIQNQDALIGPFANYNKAIKSLNQHIDAKKEGEKKNALIEKRTRIIHRFNEIVTNGHSESGGFDKYDPTADLNWLVIDCEAIAKHKSTSQTVVRGFVGAGVATTTVTALVGAGVVGAGLLSSYWGLITLASGAGALSGALGGPVGMAVGAIVGGLIGAAGVVAVAGVAGAGYGLYSWFKKPSVQPLVIESQNNHDLQKQL